MRRREKFERRSINFERRSNNFERRSNNFDQFSNDFERCLNNNNWIDWNWYCVLFSKSTYSKLNYDWLFRLFRKKSSWLSLWLNWDKRSQRLFFKLKVFDCFSTYAFRKREELRTNDEVRWLFQRHFITYWRVDYCRRQSIERLKYLLLTILSIRNFLIFDIDFSNFIDVS